MSRAVPASCGAATPQHFHSLENTNSGQADYALSLAIFSYCTYAVQTFGAAEQEGRFLVTKHHSHFQAPHPEDGPVTLTALRRPQAEITRKIKNKYKINKK